MDTATYARVNNLFVRHYQLDELNMISLYQTPSGSSSIILGSPSLLAPKCLDIYVDVGCVKLLPCGKDFGNATAGATNVW